MNTRWWNRMLLVTVLVVLWWLKIIIKKSLLAAVSEPFFLSLATWQINMLHKSSEVYSYQVKVQHCKQNTRSRNAFCSESDLFLCNLCNYALKLDFQHRINLHINTIYNNFQSFHLDNIIILYSSNIIKMILFDFESLYFQLQM